MKQRKRPVQRPRGRNTCGVFEKHCKVRHLARGETGVGPRVGRLAGKPGGLVIGCGQRGGAEGLRIASAVLGLFPSLPLTSWVVSGRASASWWAERGSPCLLHSFVSRTKEMTHDPVPRMWGEMYSFYLYNQRFLGMGYRTLSCIMSTFCSNF